MKIINIVLLITLKTNPPIEAEANSGVFSNGIEAETKGKKGLLSVRRMRTGGQREDKKIIILTHWYRLGYIGEENEGGG